MTRKLKGPLAGRDMEISARQPVAKSEAILIAEEEFNETLYLRLNPDVMIAVAKKFFSSGREHYERLGRAEGRLITAPETMQPNQIVMAGPVGERPRAPAAFVEEIRLSPSGGLFVVGWLNDTVDLLECIDLYCPFWSISLDASSMARVRRTDAESAIGLQQPQSLGFWHFIYIARPIFADVCTALFQFKSGASAEFCTRIERIGDQELRKIVLSYLAQANYPDNQYFSAVQELEAQCGAQLVSFNRMLTQIALNAPYVERFGREDARYRSSIVVCLFERLEYFFFQQAIFARQDAIDNFEFIYVCNSPNLAEPLLREARSVSLIYGLDLTIIVLNSNAGFAGANNVAAQHARSSRLIFLNPDVFPRDTDWAVRHSMIVETLPEMQTSIFGAPLFYDDGSMMHAGMYFEVDSQPLLRRRVLHNVDVIRVEHYGKGAPPETLHFLRARSVPAVTGAFMSFARGWFERLDGFSSDYIFGHYEDADLCLRSLNAGRPTWLHDAKLWHLEGHGSTKEHQHIGGAIINRWLFTRNWKDTVKNGLLGYTPSHIALQMETNIL